MTTITNLKAGLLAASLAAVSVPSIAAALSAGDTAGTTETDIRAVLEAEGYDIKGFEYEDDEIEVEAMLDGKLFEIEISPKTGVIMEVELDDDDDDDDD